MINKEAEFREAMYQLHEEMPPKVLLNITNIRRIVNHYNSPPMQQKPAHDMKLKGSDTVIFFKYHREDKTFRWHMNRHDGMYQLRTCQKKGVRLVIAPFGQKMLNRKVERVSFNELFLNPAEPTKGEMELLTFMHPRALNATLVLYSGLLQKITQC